MTGAMAARVRSRSTLLISLLLIAGGGGAGAAELLPFRIEQGAIAASLTGAPGNPARGRLIVRDTGRVTCLICHSLPIADEPDQGGLGPPLAGVGNRYTPGQLRLRLVDPKAINPETIMPSYYRVGGLHRVWQPFRDQPIYTAEQVEDVVAYLASLKDN